MTQYQKDIQSMPVFERQPNCYKDHNMAPLLMADPDMNAKSVIPKSKIKYFFKIKLLCIVLHFWEPNGSTKSESITRFIGDT